jgi:hypothetical protein
MLNAFKAIHCRLEVTLHVGVIAELCRSVGL